MNRYLCIVAVLFLASVRMVVLAQEPSSTLRRTAEERAMKQTEMLVRDLEITDSSLRDTIYRVHLQYVRRREQANSRTETVECINRLLAELKGILTPEQYERLQSIPRRQGARTHHAETDSLGPSATSIEP